MAVTSCVRGCRGLLGNKLTACERGCKGAQDPSRPTQPQQWHPKPSARDSFAGADGPVQENEVRVRSLCRQSGTSFVVGLGFGFQQRPVESSSASPPHRRREGGLIKTQSEDPHPADASKSNLAYAFV
jgi:hypothetical protein